MTHYINDIRLHCRVKCVACRVISHEGCISTLNDRFPCKETFRECVRTYREQTVILHHWVTRLVSSPDLALSLNSMF